MYVFKPLCLSLSLLVLSATGIAQERESVSFENTYYVGVKSTLASKLGQAFREFNKGGNAELADLLTDNGNVQEFRLKISISGTNLEAKISSLLKEVMKANPYLRDLPKEELLQIRDGLVRARISPPEIISQDAYVGAVVSPSPLGRRFARITQPNTLQKRTSLSFGEVMVLDDNSILRAEIILSNAKISNLDQLPIAKPSNKKYISMNDLSRPSLQIALNTSLDNVVRAKVIPPANLPSPGRMLKNYFSAGVEEGEEYSFNDSDILTGRFIITFDTEEMPNALVKGDKPNPQFPRLQEMGAAGAFRLASMKTHNAFCSLYAKGDILARDGFNPTQKIRKYDPYLGVQAQCLNK